MLSNHAFCSAGQAVLPRLHAFLRHACFDSGEASFPALLPFVALVPGDIIGATPAFHVRFACLVQISVALVTRKMYASCFSW